MVRGPRKHLKRLAAPKSWLLDKSGGVYAPRPSTGPHKLEECIPLCILLSKKLGYAQNSKEIKHIMKNRMIMINGKVRTDPRYPVGIMDILSIPKTGETFRLLYNTSGRFFLHRLEKQENFTITKVIKKVIRKGKVPYIYTEDGGSFRYCDLEINVGDSVKVDLETRKVVEFLPIAEGNIVYLTRGKNMGCSGVIVGIDKDIVKIKDSNDRYFSTLKKNLLVIGKEKSWISLGAQKGVKVSEYEMSNRIYGEIIAE
ncbi:40S ribosomal protein S4 [Dictyocoela muelleri]|nr:40S ribosomal protein S4 [Dictyocoela muelleri]